MVNHGNLDRRAIYRRIHDMLYTQASEHGSSIKLVKYHPSNRNPQEIHADINPNEFIDEPYPASKPRIEIYFDFPNYINHIHYQIQWIEPDRNLMIGWHQDETHPNLGKCHFQIDHKETSIQRTHASHLDKHPINIFTYRLNQLPTILSNLEKKNMDYTVDEKLVR